MRHGTRTVPLAVLAAVVLALLAALAVAGPGATGGPSAGVAAAVGHHGDGPPRADAGHGLDPVLRSSVRHEQHGEHPAPRGHLALRDEDTAVVPPRLGRLAAPTGRAPFTAPHPTQDRGRAPPVLSGT
ncbi:hypothetical protein PV379_14085 [Streptomyces caniscabiei]|uniref:hypothetical protein n=1 Tax=Streptomyces caniscabiei TaxID=2746961 RepID=UPI0029A57479|nr:hypothetical protein [Streptomyces caniscabiei]MDX2600140.1 hypothetical protein [Streptomyces caniscabiei]MDX2734567.1 hypothetical protein [Streptomyces caniscabiei]MDX2778431.1 hypothetical protein [Streptomyces caniscabiei]